MQMQIVAALMAMSLADTGYAKDMKSCAADYRTAKAGTALGGQSYTQFMAACMKGGTSVSQTITTKPSGGPAVTKTIAAPTAAAAGAPARATAKCKDGSYTIAAHHSGSCSHHGGVAQFLR